MEIPLKIVEKYKGMDSNGKLLPMLTKESMNRHLKKKSVMCGINRPISFHQAWHSFACLQLDAGTSIAVVQRYLGHKNVATTEVYAKISDAQKRASVGCITLKK